MDSGIVRRIDGRKARVELLLNHDECAGCRIASLCNSKESVDIEAVIATERRISVGDIVKVQASAGQTTQAVVLLLLVPLLVFMAAIIGLQLLGVSDIISVVCALAAAVICYGLLMLFRRRNDSISWRIVA